MLNNVFKGSMTHLQNIVGGLEKNKVIVMWNDSLWWQTMKWLNHCNLMQLLIEKFIVFF